MLGVKVIYRYFWQLDRNGYWFDSSDGKLTLRNSENSPLFEVIHDPHTHENILMTKENVYYTYEINILCDAAGHPSLCFGSGTNGIDIFPTNSITIDENGNEIEPVRWIIPPA